MMMMMMMIIIIIIMIMIMILIMIMMMTMTTSKTAASAAVVVVMLLLLPPPPTMMMIMIMVMIMRMMMIIMMNMMNSMMMLTNATAQRFCFSWERWGGSRRVDKGCSTPGVMSGQSMADDTGKALFQKAGELRLPVAVHAGTLKAPSMGFEGFFGCISMFTYHICIFLFICSIMFIEPYQKLLGAFGEELFPDPLRAVSSLVGPAGWI